ncbi:hypothetical protein [Natrinema sp. 1APR25-10V2]|uniref:hypothetical protein n=1 Tax=Natrinema sp. 1APR25-10V2 TaxID=2951081 RepID=UPI002875C815|nr:hypothetical protein [Natrinema sp. 1APR25-10V2]MDS0475591.1 hypothetical protein [Natrinema sp. 1APR25-10V2]
MSRGRGPGRGRTRSSELTSAADQLKIAFVLLVGLSGGLIALQSGAPLAVIGAAILGGVVAGGALLWYLVWITTD